MLTTPTYLSSKLEESPVEDVTLCCYHMFTVYVYCLCLCLLSCCPLAGRGAESCSFTSALVVCRLATVCPPVWPSRAWPVWSCRVWVRELGTRGPGHRTGTQRRAESSFRGDQWPEMRLRLCQGSGQDWGGGQDIRYSDQWQRDGARIKLYLARGQYYTDRISIKARQIYFMWDFLSIYDIWWVNNC